MPDYFPSIDSCPRHAIFPGVVASTWWGEKLMMSYVTLEPRSVVAEHSHPHEQMGILLKGRAIFIIGGVEKTLQAGDRYYMPSNVPHKVITLDEPSIALDVFHPPREEYK
jgi:quercetin dioxygenase-like cupin family protein